MDYAQKTMNVPSKFSISAPGKVILHGEHSVVYGHLAIAASLNLRTKAYFEQVLDLKADSQHVQLVMPDIGLNLQLSSSLFYDLTSLASEGNWDYNHPENVDFEKLVYDIQTYMSKEKTFAALTKDQHQAVKCFFFLMIAILHQPNDEKIRLNPFKVRLSSELPVGAGAGSSASFCVSVAALFICILKLVEDTKEQFRLDDEIKDLISSWAFLGERITHGNPSGLDNSICTYGSLIAFRRPKEIGRIPLNNSLRVILVDTKVTRNTHVLVDSVAKLRGRHENIVKAIMEAMDCISSEAVDILKQLDAAEQNQANGGTIQLFSRMEELWSINHSLLTALGVSHPSLEHIIQISREHNLSGKLTGAGGGGFAIVLIPKCSNKSETALSLLKEAFRSCGFDVKDVELGGPGVQVHIV